MKDFFLILSYYLVILLCLAILVYPFVLVAMADRKNPADYQEVTSNYHLPPELKGCKIFVLGGQWSATNPLWVIVPPQGLERPLIID
jgi:ABC-type anion transport system duplicated permease subunit